MDARAVLVLWISCSTVVCTADLEKTNLHTGELSDGVKAENGTVQERDEEIFVEDEENHVALRLISLAEREIEGSDDLKFQGKKTNSTGESIYKQTTYKEDTNRRSKIEEGFPEPNKGNIQDISTVDSKNIKPRKVTTEKKENVTQKEIVNVTSLDGSEEIPQPINHDTKQFERSSSDGDKDDNKKANRGKVKFVRRISPKVDEELVRIAFQQELKNKIYMVEQENAKTIKKRSFDLWSIFGLGKEEPKTVLKVTQEVPVAVPYTVEKKIVVPVKVEVERPVPVEVPRPYPVQVEKKVYYPVKEYVHAPYPVYKKVPYMVKMFVENPVPVHVSKPYPVYIEKKVPYAVEKQIPVAVRVPVDRPYPVPVPVMKNVYYPVEKRVPYPVAVPVEKPVAVPVEKPYPVYIERQVPVQVEKEDQYAVPEPVEEHTYEHFETGSYESSGKFESDFVPLEEQKNDFDGSIELNDLRKADNGFVQLTNNPILRKGENDKTKIQKDVDEASKPTEERKSEIVQKLSETASSQVQQEDNIKLKDETQEFGRKIKKNIS